MDTFGAQGGFPTPIENGLPLSEVAERHYTKGPPLLSAYLPYWLADLLVQLGIVTFGLAAIVYPISKVIPHSRIMKGKVQMDDLYEELRNVERQLQESPTPTELAQLLGRWEGLEKELRNLRLPSGTHAYHRQLLSAFSAVREEIQKQRPSALDP